MTELSARVGSAPVVMFHLNVSGDGLVPASAEKGADLKREPVNPTAPSGRMLCEGKVVDIGNSLQEVENLGYVPTRFLSVARFQGIMHRMILVCVYESFIEPGVAKITEEQRRDFTSLIRHFLWDSRIHRNPGVNGGNFIVGNGNPKPAKSRQAQSLLRIDSEKEFEIVRNDEEKKVLERKAEIKRIGRELLKRLA